MVRVPLIIAGLSIVACTAAPPLAGMVGEPVAIFPVSVDAPEKWTASGVSGEAPDSDWVSQFDDPKLSLLVQESLQSNPTILAQLQAVETARAQARIVSGGALPTVSASISRTDTSSISFFSGERVTGESFGASLNLSWEADLWGRLRTRIDAAEADLIASEADLAAAQLALMAQTSIAWFDLNDALAQERVAIETFEARTRALELTERRLARGLSTILDVRTARTTQATAEATISARRLAKDNATRRLEILLGRYPSAELESDGILPELKEVHSVGSPTLLLARRPDIAAEEARVRAAGLRAEQARLAMLPSFGFTGSASTSEDSIADALDPSKLAARLVSSLVAPVFNGGVLDAERDAAVARARIAVQSYAESTLAAWQEVESALTAEKHLKEQEVAQLRAVEEARLAEELATRQYTNGLVSIFNLIDSQTRRLNAESGLIAIRSARANNRVALHLALGG